MNTTRLPAQANRNRARQILVRRFPDAKEFRPNKWVLPSGSTMWIDHEHRVCINHHDK